MASLYRLFEFVGARVERADGTASVPLGVKSSSITFDWTWSPYVQGQLVCAEPATLAQLLSIDPRSGLYVRFTLKQTDIASGAVVTRPFSLFLRARTFDWLSRELTLTVASDESRWQDWADGADWSRTQYYVDSIIGDAVNRMGWSDGTNFLRSNYSGPEYVNDPVLWAAGQTGWDFISDLADSGNFRVWFDETAVGYMTAATYRPDTAQRYLDEPINVVDTINRDDPTWGTGAVVVYKNGAVQSLSGTEPRKIITSNRDRNKPASNAAVKIRTNALKRGRTLQLTVPARIDARPLQSWQATYLGQTANGIAQTVSLDLPTGLMTMMLNVIEN